VESSPRKQGKYFTKLEAFKGSKKYQTIYTTVRADFKGCCSKLFAILACEMLPNIC
jgi:predicted DNA-binding ArsR family transcriptional regulator